LYHFPDALVFSPEKTRAILNREKVVACYFHGIVCYNREENMVDEKAWYLGQSPLGAAYAHFSNVARQKTVLDPKTKELIRVAVASVFLCEHCTEHHIKDAFAAGATTHEVSEALLLSALQAAGTQLNGHKDFFEAQLTRTSE
jgi:AhpD family alkylhydroperoxidase